MCNVHASRHSRVYENIEICAQGPRIENETAAHGFIQFKMQEPESRIIELHIKLCTLVGLLQMYEEKDIYGKELECDVQITI